MCRRDRMPASPCVVAVAFQGRCEGAFKREAAVKILGEEMNSLRGLLSRRLLEYSRCGLADIFLRQIENSLAGSVPFVELLIASAGCHQSGRVVDSDCAHYHWRGQGRSLEASRTFCRIRFALAQANDFFRQPPYDKGALRRTHTAGSVRGRDASRRPARAAIASRSAAAVYAGDDF